MHISSTDYKGLTLSQALLAISRDRAFYAEACFVFGRAADAITQAGISKPSIVGNEDGDITLAWRKKEHTFLLWASLDEDNAYVCWAAGTGDGECACGETFPEAPLSELMSDLRRFLRKGAPVGQKLLSDYLVFDVRDLTAKRDATEFIITSTKQAASV